MANAPRPLIAGNWKMNGTRADLETLAAIASGARSQSADAMICPPATLLASAVAQVHGSDLLIGAQDCHAEASGAHTGDVSAEMIADVG
ncbi:MAG: triose-phosphate isomerase, partial [Pseudomonadota bacterium]